MNENNEPANATPEDTLEQLLSGDSLSANSTPEREVEWLARYARAVQQDAAAIPAPNARGSAMNQMLNQLENTTMHSTKSGLLAMLSAWWARPAMRTAMAGVAAVAVVGGAGFGAAAATGNAGSVGGLLGISSDSTIKVELTGTVVSIDANTVIVDASGDVRTVIIDSQTKIRRGNDGPALGLTDIVVGGLVNVEGRLLTDNTILARDFRLDAGDLVPTPSLSATPSLPTQAVPTQSIPTQAPATSVPVTPIAEPTRDDDDGDDDDNSGSGDGDDDDGDDSGSGSGDGDDDGDDGSGSGTAGDGDGDGDDDGDDGSGSGTGGGGDDDDDSGSDSAGGDDDEDDD